MASQRRLALLLSTFAASAAFSPLAHAQSGAPASTQLADASATANDNDIIVTARRQRERVQDVPIPLSVVTGATLEERGAYTLEDIQRQAPSFTAYNSNPRNSSVGIRGIGISSASDGLDTSVGFYFDNVYLGRPGMALSDLIDIDRFEILRGPQGTLFGRNTSGGVVNVTTKAPSFDPAATIEASLGNYNYRQLRLSLTGPLIPDRLAARLTTFNTIRDGVLDNRTTGDDANSVQRDGVRLQFLYTPSESVSLRIAADYSEEDDTCCVSVLDSVLPLSTGGTTARTLNTLAALGYVPTATNDYTLNNAPQHMQTDQHGLSAELNWDLGALNFTSITAYRFWHFAPLQDSDGLPLDVIQVNVAQTDDWQYTQEFRLASDPGRFDWQVGAYFFSQKLKDHYILNQFGTDASAFYTFYNRTANPAAPAVTIAPGSQYIGDTTTTSDAWAVFGQFNYDITDWLTLTSGLRYTEDERWGRTITSTRGTPFVTTSIPFNHDKTVNGDNISYLVTLGLHPNEGQLIYLTYSTGYKAAGLNLNAAVTTGTSIVVAPEEVSNWEIGLKQTLFDGRAIFNINAFSMDLTGLQANIAPPGVRSYLANVGDVESRGVEAEFSWHPTERLWLSANASYTHATYASYANAPCAIGVTAPCDLTGRPLFQSPEWIANANLRYEFPSIGAASPYVSAQASYRSEAYGDVQLNEAAKIDAYTLASFRLGATFDDERYDIALWVDNAFDEDYFQSLGSASVVGAGAYGFSGRLGTPRTFGVTARARF